MPLGVLPAQVVTILDRILQLRVGGDRESGVHQADNREPLGLGRVNLLRNVFVFLDFLFDFV